MRQQVQPLPYSRYATTLNFFCALPLGFLNGLQAGSVSVARPAVENLPMAALRQQVQPLPYSRYATTLNFFCALPLGFLNGLQAGSVSVARSAVENLPMAALRQKVQPLPYSRYATTLNFLSPSLGIFERSERFGVFDGQRGAWSACNANPAQAGFSVLNRCSGRVRARVSSRP